MTTTGGDGAGAEPLLPDAEQLPELPDDIILRVFKLSCQRGGLREFFRTWRGVSNKFNDEYFVEHCRGGVPITFVPSVEAPTIQAGIAAARPASPDAALDAVRAAQAWSAAGFGDGERLHEELEVGGAGHGNGATRGDRDHPGNGISSGGEIGGRRGAPRGGGVAPPVVLLEPVVLIRPGLYRENVRVTKTVALIGLGAHGSVLVEVRRCRLNTSG